MGKHKAPPKTRWHALSLQALPPQRFSQVVNRILLGEVSVIVSRAPHDRKRVLVTDNNGDHLDAIVECLETDLGVIVDMAATPDECLRKLQTGTYDLLILDYRLPQHDGLWVIDQICEKGRRLPVLMVTSFYDERLRKRITRDYSVEVMDKERSFQSIARRAGQLLATTCARPAAG